MGTKYDNCDVSLLARTGGSVVVTVAMDAAYGPLGVHPVSIPCRGCFVSSRNAKVGSTIMAIGTGRDPALRGVYIAMPGTGAQPMWVQVSDVSQLYFSAGVGEKIDIVYLLG